MRMEPTDMTQDIADRLARVEVHVEALIDAQTGLQADIKSLVAQISELAAALKFPDPRHCTLRGRMEQAEADIRNLKSWADHAQGAGIVLKWLVGGNLLGFISLLSLLLWAISHMPKGAAGG